MDELIHHHDSNYELIHKKHHPQCYQSDITYHVTLIIMFSVIILKCIVNEHVFLKEVSLSSNIRPSLTNFVT